ncbi:MAG: hypothetical protein Hals2KO_14900 [Halioglobus sp.]
MPFSQTQIDLMRRELASIYRCLKARNSKYSYPTLWDTINDHFEDLEEHDRALLPEGVRDIRRIELLQKDNFRKFVVGEVISPEKEGMIEAIFFWLTDPETEFSSLTRQSFLEENVGLALFESLANFLNPGGPRSLSLEPENLVGEYFGVVTQGISEKKLRLSVSNSVAPNVFEVMLSEISDSQPERAFGGYAVWAEPEILLFMLRESVEERPRLFASRAISTEFYVGENVSAFVCRDFSDAESIDNSIIDMVSLSNFAISELDVGGDNLMKFLRES